MPIPDGLFIAILENIDRMDDPELRQIELRVEIRRELLKGEKRKCSCGRPIEGDTATLCDECCKEELFEGEEI